MDWRLVVLLAWGGGTVLAYGRVLWLRRQAFALHRDRRSRRDYLSAVALFFVALFSALSIASVLFGEAGTAPRSFVLALALGSFLGAGILMATEREK